MPWFAWLFLLVSVPAVAWWLLDECHHNKTKVRTDDTLTALARAVGVYTETPTIGKGNRHGW